jgi:thioredoxin reductase/ferredoxin
MWPAGVVEKLPEVNADGSTRIDGVYIVGDLTGIPLLKFSSDTGARAVQTILKDPVFRRTESNDALDLVIIGAGVSGMAAALEAKKNNLKFQVLEASEAFSTIVNFPRAKPIYTYPTEMTPAGDLQFHAQVKEPLVEELRAQTRGIEPRPARCERVVRTVDMLEVQLADNQPAIRAQRVIIAIGRSGNFRKLNVPGEDLGKVYNRLHDPKEFAGKDVLVVGGGDSALETAIAIAECGGRVTLSYRKPDFSRPKPDNLNKLNRLIADPMADVQVERPSSERVTTAMGDYMGPYRKNGSITLMLSSKVERIDENDVAVVDADGQTRTIPNDAVFTMIGREAPLEFFRRSGIPIRGEWTAGKIISMSLFVAFCVFLYHWKGTHHEWNLNSAFVKNKWFPYNVGAWLDHLGSAFRNASFRPTNLLFTLREDVCQPYFYYTLAYSLLVVIFGIRRIRRRKTPYVTWQTLALMFFQVMPLFILPQIVLPWAGRNGVFEHGPQKWVADKLFEDYHYKASGWDFTNSAALDAIGNERAWWRAYGLILAWPLFVYNVFTDQPMWGWLVVSFVQTFVFIPAIVYFWGKGAYCGWICSCGALAETLGDEHRQKMPHGPGWNRLNMIGQVILWVAVVMLGLRILGWIWPGSVWARSFQAMFKTIPFANWEWFVDVLWAGIIGVGLYFWFSGRVWCRFACPLAALMHIYARFSRFRILADKKKCISCNVCTSVCHQGIDVMNFANKGLGMQDPECVRCSACVQSCPTGVLSFGQVNRRTGDVIRQDPQWLAASPVLMREIHVNGKPVPV